MNQIQQNDSSRHTQSTLIKIASIVIIIGVLTPTLIPGFNGIKINWFWQNIDFSQPSLTAIQILSIMASFIPLLLTLLMSKQKLAVAILVYILAISIYAVVLPQQLGLVSSINLDRDSLIFGLIFLTLFLLMTVSSRLALSIPARKFPFVIMGIISFLFLALFLQRQGITAYTDLFNTNVWKINPAKQLLNIFFTLFLAYTLLSSFKIFSSKPVVPSIYFLLTAIIIMMIYELVAGSIDIPGAAIYMYIKFLIVGAAYITLYAASLYACGYMLGNRK